MPEYIAVLLMKFQNEIWMAFLGFMGGCVRLAIGHSNGERMPPTTIFATLVTGGILAATSNAMFAGYLGLGAGSASFCSFFAGIMGMKLVNQAMAYEFPTIFKGKAND